MIYTYTIYGVMPFSHVNKEVQKLIGLTINQYILYSNYQTMYATFCFPNNKKKDI
jgi:uncharacterized membrane protein YjdF